MTHKQLWILVRAEDPRCIQPLLDMITFAAMEILRLEAERDRAQMQPDTGQDILKLWQQLFPGVSRKLPAQISPHWQKRSRLLSRE